MSLSIQKEKGLIRVRYQDDERAGEVVIDLNENRIVLHEIRNLRIIFEAPKQALQGISKIETKEKTKLSISQLKHALKKEILEILSRKGAFRPESSLSLDDIFDIAQYEKESYPFINKLIHEAEGLPKAKRLLALVLAGLRREGKIAKIEVRSMNKIVTRYYLLHR